MKNNKRIPIEKILLYTIAGVGLVAAVALAPGIGPALKLFGFGKHKYSGKYLESAVGRLKNKGFIVFEEKNGKKFIRLTSLGKNRLKEYEYKNISIPKPKKWDKKWRIVVFDIPEKRKAIRNKLRNTLIDWGFVRLQNSIWVYPYECEELVVMLKADLKVGKDILYIVAEKVEYDKNFKKLFKL